jgi:ribokinase
MDAKPVTVIGSYNVGLFYKAERLPGVGETVIGNQFWEGGGGKGSNQAIAASRLGARVHFIGRIGNDKYGADALAIYERFGVSSKNIRIDPETHSGISVIFVDQNGHNQIMVVPGANFELQPEDIAAAESVLAGSCIVGFQLENHLAIVDYAIRKVHSMGVATLLDPAPAAKLPEDLYPCIDYIKPNETEATTLTGISVADPASAEKAGRWLLEHGVGTAIVTLGKEGAVLVTRNRTEYFLPPEVDATDSTGAGDVFAGALMAAISQGMSIEEAIVFSNQAAALSVTRLGVIDAIPSQSEVMASFATLKSRSA